MNILKPFFLSFLLLVAFSFAAYSQTASVISKNSNLRGTPTNKGKVIETLAKGSVVEVIKQKSQWFLVQSSAHVGWVHGNTIRLEEQSLAETTYEGYSVFLPSPEDTKANSSTEEKKIMRHPRIGMTTEEARNSTWGEPDKINRTTTASGVQLQWIYYKRDSLTGVIKWKTLYFNNGRLTSINE
jgi:uncharacterized protein YgiM (DUF1202 family)